jgi:hypothetical protein
MASMLSPVMCDRDLLSALITHYEPRIQTCLISANVKTTQESIAVLAKLHSLENLNETYRTPRREYERKDHAWGTPRGHFGDGTGNHRPNDNMEVRHIRHANWDRNQRGCGDSVSTTPCQRVYVVVNMTSVIYVQSFKYDLSSKFAVPIQIQKL